MIFLLNEKNEKPHIKFDVPVLPLCSPGAYQRVDWPEGMAVLLFLLFIATFLRRLGRYRYKVQVYDAIWYSRRGSNAKLLPRLLVRG